MGMYHRVNTNRVRAFGGGELDPGSWLKLFGHYINMELSQLVLRLLQWYAARYPEGKQIDLSSLQDFATTLHLGEVHDLNDTVRKLNSARLGFEAMINNVADSDMPAVSLQGAPVDVLLAEVKELPQFGATAFFFLLDEYENFDASQQRVVNTLIKHCGELYSFKISVREFGFEERGTLSDHERLVHPADYKLIDIAGELGSRFTEFAAGVCGRRIGKMFNVAQEDPRGLMRSLFPDVSPEEEARLLGVARVVAPLVKDLRRSKELGKTEQEWLRDANDLEVYTLVLRSRAETVTPAEKLSSVAREPLKWKQQYGNYKYAYLFTIRKGKRGIRKHYCGWTVYCQLASGNIRLLLELVGQAFTKHGEDAVELGPVSPKVQTEAAQVTGQRKIRELEGVSLNGAKIARFLLGLGRVFQVMSEDPVGHTPEVNQFHLSNDAGERREELSLLLKEGVMHLALLWYPARKMQEQTDVRQFDYTIHPIFAPFFGFSHRRKRKVRISDTDFLTLADNPRKAIASLLEDQRRIVDHDLPDQLRLFSEIYGIGHDH